MYGLAPSSGENSVSTYFFSASVSSHAEPSTSMRTSTSLVCGPAARSVLVRRGHNSVCAPPQRQSQMLATGSTALSAGRDNSAHGPAPKKVEVLSCRWSVLPLVQADEKAGPAGPSEAGGPTV